MGFGGVLKKAFPFISAAASLGGPIGVMAANAVGNALGVEKVSPTPEGIESAILLAQSKDPEALVKLREAEQKFQTEMTKLGFDHAEALEHIAAEDRENARAREIAVRDHTPAYLALAVTLGFFGLLATFCLTTVPERSHDILLAMVATLGTAWISIVSYYFGSSSGSAAKTALLAEKEGLKP